jgi:hypothetical protein
MEEFVSMFEAFKTFSSDSRLIAYDAMDIAFSS